MKKLYWIDDGEIQKVRDQGIEAHSAEMTHMDENALIVTYIGKGLSPDQFVKLSRKLKLELEASIASLEQRTKRKFEIIFATDENHIRKMDEPTMRRLGWQKIKALY